jgi:hypothetical protein
MAIAEHYRVRGFYAGASRKVRYTPLEYRDTLGNIVPEKEVPTDTVIEFAKESPGWETRAKATLILGQRAEQRIPEILLQICETDSDLEVRKSANEAFGAITASDRVDVLECGYARKWWEEHKTEVLQKLTP